MKLNVAVITLIAMFVFCGTLANAHSHRCQHSIPSRWQYQAWNHPTTHLMSLPLIPLEYATEQVSQILDYFGPQPEKGHVPEVHDGGMRNCAHHGDNLEPQTEKPTRQNLIDKSLTWKRWMEDMTTKEWEDNWPLINEWGGELTEDWPTLWERGKEKEREDVVVQRMAMEDESYYQDMIQKKEVIKQKIAQHQEEIRQLEHNIENQLARQREEQTRIQLERDAEVRQQKQAERRRVEHVLQEKMRIENEQKELEKQMRHEKERLRQLTEQHELLNQRRMGHKGANQTGGERVEMSTPHQDATRRLGGNKQHDGQQGRAQARQPKFQQRYPQNVQAKHKTLKEQLFSLQIPSEYSPRDIKVRTSGAAVKVTGKRVCECNENCVVKEFERGFKLPQGVTPDSLKVRLFSDGRLSIEGATDHKTVSEIVDADIPVQPVGVFEDNTKERLECMEKKSGFKMSKINKKTGETYHAEEFAQMGVGGFSKHVESDYEDDGVTIEVVEE